MTCPSGKIAYATRAQASKARAGVMARPGFVADPLNVYCCGHCGSFHLGRDVRRGSKARTKNRPHEVRETFARLNRWKALTE
jgi:hypothetical protein